MGAIIGGTAAWGQGTTTATVLGIVTDASGAAIGGADLTIRNAGTGAIQRLETDGQGRYRGADLVVGEYEVQAAKTGFSTVVYKNVNLTVGSQTVVDFTLPVGQSQQTVTVQAEVSQVENMWPPRARQF